MAILSIQSAVVYGHVGNSAAALPLQRLGFEVWRLDTVSFSNHPGHGRFTGRVVPASALAELVDGLEGLGVLGECQGVLTGYLGEAANAEVAADAIRRVKQANPQARYVLDPVIGDEGRVYVRPGVAEAIRDRLLPLAEVVKPNLFELGWLTGRSVEDLAGIRAAALALIGRGPQGVIVTGLRAGDRIRMLAVSREAAFAVSAPYVPRGFNGTGDLVAALALGHLLKGEALPAVLALAASGVAEAIQATLAAGTKELALVEAVDRIVKPPSLLAVERLD
jgi:pyridoxine kinase